MQLFKQLKKHQQKTMNENFLQALCWFHLNRLLVLYYEAAVESITNFENTGSRGSYTKFIDVDSFQIGRNAGKNGNKKALINLKIYFLD